MTVISTITDPSIFVVEPGLVCGSLEPTAGEAAARKNDDRTALLEWEAQATSGALEVLSQVEASDSLEHGCNVLVNGLRQLIGCEQVALGLCANGSTSFRLIVGSGSAALDRTTAAAHRLEAALAEVTIQKQAFLYPPQSSIPGRTMLAHERLSTGAGGSQLLSSPLRSADGTVIGALIFFGQRGTGIDRRYHGFVKACELRIANCLRLLRRAEPGWLPQLLRRAFVLRSPWRRRLALAGIGVALAGLLFPIHYRVGSKCRTQPEIRRFVTAPFDGTLEKSLVEPGDVVDQGQTLARMDGRELRWESSGLEADRNRAAVKRNACLAKHEMGAARSAELEHERLDLKLRVMQSRAEHLEIKSPIHGVVINGDLKRAEGMPVTVGQSLFEVAPLDHMIFELDVPEGEYSHVSVGQDVTIALDAFSSKRWQGKIAKIYPRAETRESEEVFVADVAVEGFDGALRPGMNGKATIMTDRHCMAWILFHKPWKTLLTTLGW